VSGELPRLAVRLHGGQGPHASVELARLAERSGLASLWFAENPFARGVMPAAAASAAATSRLGIGIGVVNPYSRHPTLIAMEAGALDELSGGRARLGIGSGIGAAVRRMGFGYERPLSAVREAILILRALLRGEAVSYRGHVFSVEGARLDFMPARPDMPILMAAMGDRGIALAGRIADGLIVSNLCPRGYTERAALILRDVAAKAGRPVPEIVQYVPCVLGPDGRAAREAAREAIGEMLVRFWPASGVWPEWRETMVDESGIPRAEVVAALDRLRRGEPPREVLDERYVAAFAIAGTADQCLDQARDYRRAGADELALGFVGLQPQVDLVALADAIDRSDSRPAPARGTR
jgi:5,10-methylenetetrahydromethanopterin reductase